MSTWSAWDPCSDCSQYQQRRSRLITTFPLYGGSACPGVFEYKQCQHGASCPARPTGTCPGGVFTTDAQMAALSNCSFVQGDANIKGTVSQAAMSNLAGLVNLQGSLTVQAAAVTQVQLPLLETVTSITLVQATSLTTLNATKLTACDEILASFSGLLTLINLPKLTMLQSLTVDAQLCAVKLDAISFINRTSVKLSTLNAPMLQLVRLWPALAECDRRLIADSTVIRPVPWTLTAFPLLLG